MNKKALNSAIALSAVFAFSGNALAGHYDGPPVDVNLINVKPAKYAECEKYLNDTSAKRFAACEFGRDEAERMSDRFGGGNGRIQGYLRGMSWGLRKMVTAYRNDASEMLNGEKMADGLGQYMQSGLEAGRREGGRQGDQRGRSDAIDRFVSVVNKGVNPDPTLHVPATSYQGEDDAYRKYVGQLPNERQIIQNELNLNDLKCYDGYDTVFLGDKKALTIFDILFDDGVYAFEKAYWYDPALAMSTWFKVPNTERPKYDNLNTGAPVDPATGLPYDLQAVFRQAFVGSYGYYISYYFSRTFHENLEQGALEGEMVGTQIGKRLANYVGMERAFNKKFKDSSAASFRDAFVGAYTGGFNTTFQDYATSPKLSISFDSIVGSVNDGIIQPGEVFSAKFTVKNVGGVGTPLNASVTGDVESPKTASFQIGRLMSQSFTAADIAQIDSRLRPNDRARILLHVNGLTDDLAQTVYKMMQITGSRQRLDINAGSGEVYATVTNMSTVQTPGLVTVALKLNGRDVITQQVGHVQAGDSVEVVLPFSNVDSFSFINGEVKATVVLAMNGTQTDIGELKLAAANREEGLASYFNALANGKGYVPSNQDRSDRLAEVAKVVAQINDQETRDHRSGSNLFKHNPDALMVGKLVRVYRSAVQSTEAKEAYYNLAKALWPARKNLRKFLWIRGPKRKAFENMVKELAGGRKL